MVVDKVKRAPSAAIFAEHISGCVKGGVLLRRTNGYRFAKIHSFVYHKIEQ